MPAARFELAVHLNVRQPDNQQNKKPHPDTQTRDDTDCETLTTAALTALAEVKQICLQSTKGSEVLRTAMHGGRFVYRSSPSRLTTSCSQSLLNERSSRSVGDVTDEERIPTCGVSNSGNAKVRQRPGAKQPAWNRSWAQTSSVATAPKRCREVVLQSEGFPHQIARNSRNNFFK